MPRAADLEIALSADTGEADRLTKALKEVSAVADKLAGRIDEVAASTSKASGLVDKYGNAISSAADRSEQAAAGARQAADSIDEAASSAKNMGRAVGRSGKQGRKFNQVVFSMGDAVADARFGIRGAGNNLAFMAENMAETMSHGVSFTDVMKGVGASLLGTGGIILGIQTLIAFGPEIAEFFSSSGQAAKQFQKDVKSAFDSIIELEGGLADFSFGIGSEEQLRNLIRGTERAISKLESRRDEVVGVSGPAGPMGAAVVQRQGLTDAEQDRLTVLQEQLTALKSQRDTVEGMKAATRELGDIQVDNPALIAGDKSFADIQGTFGPERGLFAGTRGPQEVGPLADAQVNLGGATPGLQQVSMLKSWNREIERTGPNIRRVSKFTARWADRQEEMGVFMPELASSTKIARSAFQQLGRAVGQAAVRLDSFKSVGNAVLNVLQGVVGQFLGAAITGGLGAATGLGGFGSIFKQTLGFRAHGGPVSSGRPYIVGERGPELFVPDRSGHVMANGAGGRTLTIHLKGETRTRGTDIVHVYDQTKQVQGT